ncbi:uncharacterized protein LOC131843372 [Achroia grisella]|uniref:uncharacterized protein LOC131843372 n=1 Tax=Achroia grisella TaxID=688607 RepID=UPI0027D2FF07|nr:uncharacterized protein LOC131843372 [Achroia grisella]
MSCRRTPPEKAPQVFLKPIKMTQESDTASDRVSEPDNESSKYITQRPKRKHGDSTLSEIKEMINNLTQKQDTQTQKFDQEMKKMLQQNNDIKQSLQYMSEKYDDILNQLKQTKSENTTFKRQIKLLEQKVELLERNSKAAFLEIKNIPQEEKEDESSLVKLAQNVGLALDVPIRREDLQNIYRIKRTSNKIGPIIVEFTTKSLKEKIIGAAKFFNKNSTIKFNTSHLKLKGQPTPVYISENLTTNGRRLYFLARECVKNYNFLGTWTTKGKVFIRKKSGLPAIHITSEEDISNLKSQ